MGDSCAQGGKPGIKETGTPEDVPRTAAITHAADTKKAPADVMGALLRLELHGFPHPVAELAATVGRVACGPFPCNLRRLRFGTLREEESALSPFSTSLFSETQLLKEDSIEPLGGESMK